MQQASSKAWASAFLSDVKPSFQLDLLPTWRYSLARFFNVHVSSFLSHEAYTAFNVLQASDITIKSTGQEEN